MTDRAVRLYATTIAVLVFFVTWAAVAANPWATTKPDPRLAALAKREQRLRADAKLVKLVVDKRFATYKATLAQRQTQNASVTRTLAVAQSAPAPAVRVVNLPPLTITKTS
jgi:ABC-type histidine transport system ATPase subunit